MSQVLDLSRCAAAFRHCIHKPHAREDTHASRIVHDREGKSVQIAQHNASLARCVSAMLVVLFFFFVVLSRLLKVTMRWPNV